MLCCLSKFDEIEVQDMLGNWKIRANAPGDSLFVSISVHHPKLGEYFTATLTAKKISSVAADSALFFWLMPHRVAVWIYWHVSLLAWLWNFPSNTFVLVCY